MNGKSQESQTQPLAPLQYPDLTSKETPFDHHDHHEQQPPFDHHEQQPPPPIATSSSSSSITTPPAPHYDFSKDQDDGHQQQTTKHPNKDDTGNSDDINEIWGTHVMGTPAVPTCHPNNQKAALWGTGDQHEYQYHHYPYLQYSPLHEHEQRRTTTASTSSSVLQKFNSWSRKAEATANNIWHNLKTGPSVPGAAWAKMNLTAKAITGGGFESLYKQTFNGTSFPNEKLKKTFACYLSTSTGPVAGTLYLSNLHLAFCSDRPLSFTAPSGQQTWSYYKISIPLGNIGCLNPVIMTENPTERYIQAVTVDGQDFWFMGFVNYEKATRHLFESISNFAVSGIPVKQQSVAA